MASTAPDRAVPRLTDDELVDDRSVEAFDADRFGHGDFVRELAGVVCQTKTPANIALFGPWGSGKSGIANLLKAELPQAKAKARFVVFDASKYAEAPLRRHFISQVAHGLAIKKDDFHAGLYTGIEGRDVRFNPVDWLKLVAAFAVSVALAVVVLLLLATAVAAVSVGSFEASWSSIVRDYLLAALPVAAVVTAFVKLAADGLHVKTTRSAPSGNEEFEKRFSNLVVEAKTERLVVFIDELDRCSPAQVASVLETLKTFLFIKGCVFVVAADQQVLEQALRRKIRQNTPEDVANPYYSAGSSYLDKVFQYQLTLPPLQSPTLSRFALALVHDRPGVWQRVPALDETLPVLIPTHIASPRRVKVLLNRFAVAYRLAERRAANGQVDPAFGARATELAKLVCLQCEFPLFAEDLTLDPRLPQFVRMVADQEPLPANLPTEVARRAKAYAEGRRIVAELLVDADAGASDAAGERGEHPAAQPEEGAEDVDVNDTDEDAPQSARGDDVARQHAQQLVSYLRKTRYIAGPAPDLLYLESAGAGHGVDPVLADQLQRAALNNETVEMLGLVASAADEDQGRGALRVLSDVVRQAQPGLEGRNVVSALMQGIERSGVELGDAADPIADAVAGHLAQASLQPDDLMGALTLAGASSRALGPRLLEAVLRHPASTSRTDVATTLIGRAEAVPGELRLRLAQAATTALLSNSSEAGQQLLALPLDRARQLLRDVTKPLKRASDAHYAAVKAKKTEGEEAEEGDILDPSPADALAAAFDGVVAAKRSELGNELVKLMLAMNHENHRNTVSRRLSQLAPIEADNVIMEVLSATHRRALSDWPNWLDPIDAEAVGNDQGLQEYIDSLACAWWNKVTADPPASASEAEEAVVALARCGGQASISNDVRARVRKALDEPFTTAEVIGQQRTALRHADRLVAAELLGERALADIRLNAAVQSLGAAIARTALAGITEISNAVMTLVEDAAAAASDEALRQVLEAAADTTWLSDADRARVLLTAAAALRSHDAEAPTPVATDQLRELGTSSADQTSTDTALALWLTNFAVDPSEVWQVLEPLVEDELPPETRQALGHVAARLDNADRFSLIKRALDRVADEPVHRSFLEAAHLSEVPAHKVADRLVDLFVEIEDADAQRRVMDIWQQLAPTGDTVRKRLVEQVYLPLIASGDDGLDLALSYFGLVAPVKGVRKTVRAALRNAARTNGQKRRVDQRLLEAKWTKKSLFGFGPAVDQDGGN